MFRLQRTAKDSIGINGVLRNSASFETTSDCPTDVDVTDTDGPDVLNFPPPQPRKSKIIIGNSDKKKAEGADGEKKQEAVFVDAAALKKKVLENLMKPEYNVHDFYHKTGRVQWLARHQVFENVTLLVIGITRQDVRLRYLHQGPTSGQAFRRLVRRLLDELPYSTCVDQLLSGENAKTSTIGLQRVQSRGTVGNG